MDWKACVKKTIAKLNIFGEKWLVVSNPDLDPNFCGLCHYDKKEIEIRADLDKKTYRITTIHELLHSHFRRMGYHVSGLPKELEEVMIDQIGTTITENWDTLKKIMK
jgi:hypothetical protein